MRPSSLDPQESSAEGRLVKDRLWTQDELSQGQLSTKGHKLLKSQTIRKKLAVAVLAAALLGPVGAAIPAAAAPYAPTTFNDDACIIKLGLNYSKWVNGVKWGWYGIITHPKQVCPTGIWVRMS